MESLSRPLHRRKLSNANNFSSKNAYDGVLSGHRRNYDGAPAVTVEEYCEIFNSDQADSSIPVLDLTSLEDSSDGLNLEIWSMKPDYGMIFGGFRDQGIAICYEELVARDKARGRAPSSAIQSSQHLGELSNQPLDALKQFNMAYNKISQRSKDGLDETTHVTQLPAVSGYTCFMNEPASQPKKETENQKSFVTNSIHPSVNSSKGDFHEKQAAQSDVESKSRHQNESLSGDRIIKTFEVDLNAHPSNVSSPPAASQPNKETENRKSYITNSIHPSVNSSKGNLHEKQTSQIAVEVDLKPQPSKVSPPTAASQLNKETENQKSCIAYNIHPSVNSSKRELHEKKTSQSAVEVDLRPHPSEVSPPPAAAQLNKETENQKSYITDNIYLRVNSSKGELHEKQTSKSSVVVDLKPHPSEVSPPPPAASQLNKETENQKSYITNIIHPSVNSSKGGFHEMQISQSAVESRSRYQDKSLSSKVSLTPAASLPNKESENQKSNISTTIQPNMNSSKGDFHEKQTSQNAVESRSRYGQDESISERNFKKFQADLRSQPLEVSSSLAASATNFDNHKDYQKRSTDTYGESPPTCFEDKFDVNSAAAVSAAALRKAIEKAQENIRIAKESVGRKKGLGGFSSRSFKDSLKVKAKVANVKAGVEYEEKNDKLKERDHKHESTVVFPDLMDGEKLFGAKKVINEPHGEVSELKKNSEILIRSPIELRENMILCNSKEVVGKTESKWIENNTCEGPQKDVEKPNDFLVLEICEKNLGDNESNNLTVHQKVEDEKEIPWKFDEDGYKKKFSEESFGLFETSKQENLQQEHHKKVGSGASQVEDERAAKEEEKEKLYDVCEVEVPTNAETYACSIDINDLSQKENYEIKEKENDKAEDTWKKLDKIQVPGNYEDSSSDHDDASESRSMPGASQTVDDIEEACKVDQNGNNAELSQEIDDVSRSSSSGDEFQVEYTETIEKEKIKNISSNETADNKDECDAKSYDPANCGLADGDFVQDDFSIETNYLSQNEDYEIKERKNHTAKETWKKLDKIHVPEESKSVLGASQIVCDTEETCKVDQNDNNMLSSKEITDVNRSSSSGLEFQVKDTEATERETFENSFSNGTEDNKDECDSKFDNLANCGLAGMDFVQNDCSIETDDLSQKEDYKIKERENHKAEETWEKLDKILVPESYENSSSDYSNAEESLSVIGARQIVDDTEEACKVDQNNNAKPSQEIDDVSSSSSSSCHDFQAEDTGPLEKETIVNLSSDETEDTNSDDLANCDLADVDFVQNDMRSESSSDTMLGMEMEVNKYKEREETAEKKGNNLQQSHEETPEIRIKAEAGTQEEPDNASRESEPSKILEKMYNEEDREQGRIKLAVERAIREARARAFAEVRQRVTADTQEKVTKPSSDKTCAQSKLRAERAAVERATAEARQRALEKAMSQKKISEPKIQVKEINQTTSAINHTNAESALRSKAKLEKHNRIMERAAKALAEKEMRDLLALREQTERNRLAENLDADIKRWSSGKEGNLRALLSTLQYILGADSSWQPVSLTEIITTSAVKKAYRKATLCVHPDKLQQRGASIQQKYICEKVFDLLKAAWHGFNSEER